MPAILDSSGERVVPDSHAGGMLLDREGEGIHGLFGVGLGFADAELTSGEPYAEAGFMPFALRASEIAEMVVRHSGV